MKAVLVPLLVISVLAVEAQGQEPRLPAPAETPSPDEALIRRARALYVSRNYRESAATWQTVAVREPSIAYTRSARVGRALIAAGDLEPALAGLAEMGSQRSCRAPPPRRRRISLARRHSTAQSHCIAARARRPVERPQPTKPLSASPPRSKRTGSLVEALETYRELQLTFRQASAFDAADAAARRLSAQLRGRRTFDGSGLRLDRRSPRRRRGVSTRGRHADRMARELSESRSAR